jgi:hypothetical protein
MEEADELQQLVLDHSPINTTPGTARDPMCHAPDSSSSFFYAMHDRVAQIIATSPAMNHSEIRRSFDGLSARLKQASQRQAAHSSD